MVPTKVASIMVPPTRARASLLDVLEPLCARGFLRQATRLSLTSKSVAAALPMGTGKQVHDAAVDGRDEQLTVYLEYWRGSSDSQHVLNWIPFPDGDSPLTAAVRCDQLACVQLLLASVPGVNVDQGELNALHWASRLGRAEMVRLLLEAGPSVDINKKGFRGRAPLHWAAEAGHAAVVRVLLTVKGIVLDLEDVKRWPPLSLAMKGKHQEVIAVLRAAFEKKRELLQAGDSVFDACRSGDISTLAALAKQWRGCPEVLSCEDRVLGQTPLHVASRYGHVDAVRVLASTPGVDVNKTDREGRSPLMTSSQWGRVDVVRFLIALPGIELNMRVKCYWTESRDKTALGMAVMSSGWGADVWADKREVASLLRAAGARE